MVTLLYFIVKSESSLGLRLSPSVNCAHAATLLKLLLLNTIFVSGECVDSELLSSLIKLLKAVTVAL